MVSQCLRVPGARGQQPWERCPFALSDFWLASMSRRCQNSEGLREEKLTSSPSSKLGGVSHLSIPLPATGSSATHSRGSPPRSRYTAGQPPRQSMPWTVCVRRTPTPQGWATRSTFLDRCYPDPPFLPGSYAPPSRLPLFSRGLSTGKWKKGITQSRSADIG